MIDQLVGEIGRLEWSKLSMALSWKVISPKAPVHGVCTLRPHRLSITSVPARYGQLFQAGRLIQLASVAFAARLDPGLAAYNCRWSQAIEQNSWLSTKMSNLCTLYHT
jgi:hypothetical protein